MMWRRSVAAMMIGMVFAPVAALSSTEEGLPFLRTYKTGDEYLGHVQNWAIVQDDRGVMYFGNTDGVMEYDGHDFRLIPLSNGSIARSLVVASDGTIYVGGVGELGYLAPDDDGTLAFVSLRDEIPEPHREFADVWRVFDTSEGVLFSVSQGTLMWWFEGRFRVLQAEMRIWPYLVDGEIFIGNAELGLAKLVDGELVPVPGGASLRAMRIMSIMAWDENSLMVATSQQGLQLLDVEQGRLTPFATAVDEQLARNRLYRALELPDGKLALASYSGGLFILDHEGGLVVHLDRSTGLPDNSVWDLGLDQENGLWMALNTGLARADIASPFTVFDEAAGLDGAVESVTRFDGSVYAGTSTGLKVLRDGSFHAIEDDSVLCWTIINFSDPDRPGRHRLMAGTNTGVREIVDGREQRIAPDNNIYELAQSKMDPFRLLVGYQHGLWSYRLENGHWKDEGRVDGVDTEVRSIAEDAAGKLWIGSLYEGVIRLELSSGNARGVRNVEFFGVDHGLPSPTSVKIVDLGDEVVFGTARGMYRFDESVGRFAADDRLAVQFDDEPVGVLRAVPDTVGDLWISMLKQEQVGIIRRHGDGGPELVFQPFLRLPKMGIYALFPESDGITWIGGTRGVFRYDPRGTTSDNRGFHTLIRRVVGGDDEVLFGGRGENVSTIVRAVPLAFADNSLRFQFSAPSFTDDRSNEYTTMLEGFDNDWSPWTRDNTAVYTNLHEGRYRFVARSRNLYGTEGIEATYSFRILPPWYRTWWAYLAYVTLALALLSTVARIRSARLESEKAHLEATVRERTAELQAHTRRLLATQTELESFSYSVSHDLQSPLRRIASYSQLLMDEHGTKLDGDGRHYLERVNANAMNLAELVDDLLTLSRVTRAELNTRRLDLSIMAHQVCAELASSDPERDVAVRIEPALSAEGDPILVGLLLQNLLGNAWKFTRATAEAGIEMGVVNRRPDNVPVFFVRDNGAGFDMQYARKLFTPFQRLHSEDDFEGSGIGLASVRRSVVRHGGTVWAEAEVGKGATFYFTLAPADERSADA